MTRIEFLRREKGITQKDMSSMIQVRQATFAQIERGHRRPWPKIRKAIAEALEVQEEDLFDSYGNPLEVDWTLPKKRAIV